MRRIILILVFLFLYIKEVFATTIKTPAIHKFIIHPIGEQRVNEPFSIRITAEDESGQVATYFQGTATLNDTTKTIFPSHTGTFTNGIWVGSVTIKKLGLDIQITAQKDNIIGVSNSFGVLLPNDKKHYQQTNGIILEIEAYSFAEDYILEIDHFTTQDDFAILLANDKFSHDPTIQQIDNSIHKFISRNTKQILDLSKNAKATITFFYDNIDLGQVDKTKLNIYYLDLVKQQWVKISSTNYPAINKITATIAQMGIYILGGPVIANSFNNFVVFPNPFKIDRDGSTIEFAGLPENVTIKIYDISGNLIKYVKNQSAKWEWNVATEVDSGIYIYVITDKDGNNIIGKIGIIR
jgi:hypothetical protein